jgi:hypothetical protein
VSSAPNHERRSYMVRTHEMIPDLNRQKMQVKSR